MPDAEANFASTSGRESEVENCAGGWQSKRGWNLQVDTRATIIYLMNVIGVCGYIY